MDDSSYRLYINLDKKNEIKMPMFLYYVRTFQPFSAQKWLLFKRVIQKHYTKFANFALLYFPHFTTFRDKPCNFTNFKMLFLAVVVDFVVEEARIPKYHEVALNLVILGIYMDI